MKTFIYIGFGVVLVLSTISANAQYTAGSYPDTSSFCAADRQAGVVEGDAAGYSRGLGEGTAQGIAQCFADPQSCNITLASCIPAAVYGETEPNDNMIAADPLLLNTSFWGQNYSANDQDWFYTETTTANQNMLITFKSSGDLAGWLMTIRDASGSIFATFDTAIAGEVPTNETDQARTYRVTLGLIGTYYIMIQPKDAKDNFAPYSVAVILEDSALNTAPQPIVGFSDSEAEPNNLPSQATPLAPSVSMYGVVNLMFNGLAMEGDDFVWGQGEDDWYVFNSHGNELVTLTFCAKELCGPGSWFVEVYDETTAKQLEAGQPRETLYPLLAVNTDTGDQGSATYHFGLKNAGIYLMRVDHKRLFSAPCARYQADVNGDGNYDQSCSCSGGDYSCTTNILNPAGKTAEQYPTCPGSDQKTEKCPVTCNCDQKDADGEPIPCITDGRDPIECTCLHKLTSCDITIDNPEAPIANAAYPVCPDGSGGGDTPTCSVSCQCTEFGGVVEIPEGAITSPYNFTWFSTQVPPNTYDTEAYQQFLNRSNQYQ